MATAGLASGERFPDALVAGARLAAADGPLLLTRAASVPPAVAGYLRTHVSDRIVLFGGPQSIATGVDPRA